MSNFLKGSPLLSDPKMRAELARRNPELAKLVEDTSSTAEAPAAPEIPAPVEAHPAPATGAQADLDSFNKSQDELQSAYKKQMMMSGADLIAQGLTRGAYKGTDYSDITKAAQAKQAGEKEKRALEAAKRDDDPNTEENKRFSAKMKELTGIDGVTIGSYKRADGDLTKLAISEKDKAAKAKLDAEKLKYDQSQDAKKWANEDRKHNLDVMKFEDSKSAAAKAQDLQNKQLQLQQEIAASNDVNKKAQLQYQYDALEQQKQKIVQEAAKPTEGDKTLDREFAKNLAEFEAGRSSLEGNLKMLDDAYGRLGNGSGKVDTGFFGGLKTKAGEAIGYETDEAEVQSQIQAAIQSSLRPILGGQFAAIEGQQIMERAFKPGSSTETNKKRLAYEIDKIKQRVKDYENQYTYWTGAGKGSLKGYGAPAPQGNSGKIRVSNGIETMEIDASDLSEAEAEGFKRVK